MKDVTKVSLVTAFLAPFSIMFAITPHPKLMLQRYGFPIIGCAVIVFYWAEVPGRYLYVPILEGIKREIN
jgi:hypothetical protein